MGVFGIGVVVCGGVVDVSGSVVILVTVIVLALK